MRPGHTHPVYLNDYGDPYLPQRITLPQYPGVVYQYVPADHGAAAGPVAHDGEHAVYIGKGANYGTTPGGGTGPSAYHTPWEREVRLKFMRKVRARPHAKVHLRLRCDWCTLSHMVRNTWTSHVHKQHSCAHACTHTPPCHRCSSCSL